MMQPVCGSVIASLNNMVPNMVVPRIPKPVHITYAVPSGSFLNASARKTALAIYPIPVMMLGMTFVNPSDIFMNTAQVTSRIPATSKYNHSILTSI